VAGEVLHRFAQWLYDFRLPTQVRGILPVRLRIALSRSRYVVTNPVVIRRYLESHPIRRLHIGCGENLLPGWLNTDLFPVKGALFLDASKQLPFPARTLDYIFSEHLIEHLEYQDGVRLVQECHRVLKPEGRLRIATPDLRFLIELHAENKTELQQRYIRWAVDTFLPSMDGYMDTFVINNFFTDWGHKFIYDEKTLRRVFENAGFVDIARFEVGQSADESLRGIEWHGRKIGDEFNALETMVLEGMKLGARSS